MTQKEQLLREAIRKMIHQALLEEASTTINTKIQQFLKDANTMIAVSKSRIYEKDGIVTLYLKDNADAVLKSVVNLIRKKYSDVLKRITSTYTKWDKSIATWEIIDEPHGYQRSSDDYFRGSDRSTRG